MSKPPSEVPQGAIRFNTDSQKMEFFAQDRWWEMATDVPYLGGNHHQSQTASNNSNTLVSGTRGIWIGGAPLTLFAQSLIFRSLVKKILGVVLCRFKLNSVGEHTIFYLYPC